MPDLRAGSLVVYGDSQRRVTIGPRLGDEGEVVVRLAGVAWPVPVADVEEADVDQS